MNPTWSNIGRAYLEHKVENISKVAGHNYTTQRQQSLQNIIVVKTSPKDRRIFKYNAAGVSCEEGREEGTEGVRERFDHTVDPHFKN